MGSSVRFFGGVIKLGRGQGHLIHSQEWAGKLCLCCWNRVYFLYRPFRGHRYCTAFECGAIPVGAGSPAKGPAQGNETARHTGGPSGIAGDDQRRRNSGSGWSVAAW
ncbi:hypothetical protein DV532_09550 [Pseudomonas sp. Leaf58]|nr:hypothetical protein DV532_09550 [Pseudomonas sp. Leaf58]